MNKLKVSGQVLSSILVISHLTTDTAQAGAPAHPVIPPKPKPHLPKHPHPQPVPPSHGCRGWDSWERPYTPYDELVQPYAKHVEPEHPGTAHPLPSKPCHYGFHQEHSQPIKPVQPIAPSHYPEQHYSTTHPGRVVDRHSQSLWPEFAWMNAPDTSLDGVFTVLIALGLWWWLNSLLPSPKQDAPKPKKE
ncbi:MAG: hypothetical protein ACFBSC_00925 [Microcoleaceae cyanobacterium]